jgi:peptidoglycan/xylan/chitin deacetylase (PgdA/CDA1 family)
MLSNRPRHIPDSRASRRNIWLSVFLSLVLTACTGHLVPTERVPDEPIRGPGFVIVTVGPQDTLASLAKTYLKDQGKGWRIAAYNGIDTPTAGQRLVIPLKPLVYGGLTTGGYQTVPVLLYDELAGEPKNPRATSTNNFQRQLRYLAENGYRTITLDQLYAFLELDDQIPAKSVVISFDTVKPWAHEIAFPLLKHYGLTAAVFVATEKIDQPGNLTWSQLAEMAAAGFDIGSQGHSGNDLAVMQPGENADAYIKRLDYEIATAKQTIEQHIHAQSCYFAYPGGDTNDLVTALLKKHDIRAAFTRKRGANPFFVDDFKLRRSVIYGHYDMLQFQQNLTVFQAAELR